MYKDMYYNINIYDIILKNVTINLEQLASFDKLILNLSWKGGMEKNESLNCKLFLLYFLKYNLNSNVNVIYDSSQVKSLLNIIGFKCCLVGDSLFYFIKLFLNNLKNKNNIFLNSNFINLVIFDFFKYIDLNVFLDSNIELHNCLLYANLNAKNIKTNKKLRVLLSSLNFIS